MVDMTTVKGLHIYILTDIEMLDLTTVKGLHIYILTDRDVRLDNRLYVYILNKGNNKITEPRTI